MYKINGPTLFSNRTNSRNHAEFTLSFSCHTTLPSDQSRPTGGVSLYRLRGRALASYRYKVPHSAKERVGLQKRVVHLLCHWHSPGEQPIRFKIQLHETMSVSTSNQTVSRCPEKQRKKEYRRALHYSAVDH